MSLGPAIPEEIRKIREERFMKEKENGKGRVEEAGNTPKLKRFFDTSKSVNDELRNEITKNIKSINKRFE